MPGLQAVQSRIAAIQSRLPQAAPTSAVSFEAALGAATRTATSRATGTSTVATPVATGGAVSGDAAVASAKKYLGVPYVWGGTNPATGLDCSGLVQRAYADLGVELPRVSGDQARAGTPVPDLASARPGDLVAFGSPVDHIGIFVGDNKMIVAPKRGDVVKVQEIYREPTAIRRVLPTDSRTAATPVSATVPAQRTASAYDALFQQASQRTGVPAVLLSAVARAESGYDPNAVSPAGARGLMQLMPGTARELGVDPMDPAQAVDGAARLLSQHLRTFGSTELALAAYNAGPGAVRRHDGVPPYKETQDYVQKVMSYAGLRP
jgi:cell wall-associated NlpC family hydrolase